MKTNWKEVFIYILAALIIICFMSIVMALIFHLVPESNNSTLQILVGVFGTMTVQVGNYFYGSSKGSSDKTAMLYNSTPVQQIVSKAEDAVK